MTFDAGQLTFSSFPCKILSIVKGQNVNSFYGPLAHLVERCIRIAEVAGSTPVRSTASLKLRSASTARSFVMKNSDWDFML